MEFDFINNKKFIVDLEMLKNSYLNGRLENQHIFARLFCLDDNTPFKQNEKINKNIFINYDINISDWNHFITFIKNGIVPHLESKNGEYILNNINKLCNKLGGIYEFDKFYKKFYKEKEIEREIISIYNPLKPEEDIKNIYDWKLIDDTNGGIIVNQNKFPNNTKEIILSSNTSLYSSPEIYSKELLVLDVGTTLSVLRNWKVSKSETWVRVELASNKFLDDPNRILKGWIKM